ncbi:MAG: hypothetical protein JKX85_00055 [Phycisphaeraceae bacterium]|nr:hypothetical protein [Phycisphaeraceae bacterium]
MRKIYDDYRKMVTAEQAYNRKVVATAITDAVNSVHSAGVTLLRSIQDEHITASEGLKLLKIIETQVQELQQVY